MQLNSILYMSCRTMHIYTFASMLVNQPTQMYACMPAQWKNMEKLSITCYIYLSSIGSTNRRRGILRFMHLCTSVSCGGSKLPRRSNNTRNVGQFCHYIAAHINAFDSVLHTHALHEMWLVCIHHLGCNYIVSKGS